MIDYDKLKMAHELAEKYARTYEKRCELILDTIIGSINDSYCITFSYDTNDSQVGKYYYIDNLITKLRELTKPEPKYQMGQKLFMRLAQDIREVTVQEIPNDWHDSYKVEYFWDESQLWDDDFRINENELYPTKSALIEAQIEYWTAMREPVECQHESDDRTYWSVEYDDDAYICTKCGEFYK